MIKLLKRLEKNLTPREKKTRIHSNGKSMSKNELTNIDVTLFALYKLEGAVKKIHTEHIAWEAYKLAPEKFSWRLKEYREKNLPDKTLVRHSLEKAKEVNLVIGKSRGDRGGEREGWQLTPEGVIWIEKNLERISKALEVIISSYPREESTRFLKKIKKSQLYNLYLEDSNLFEANNYMLTDMLNCTPEATSETKKRIFNRFFNTALLVDDSKVLEFLEKCKIKFNIPD